MHPYRFFSCFLSDLDVYKRQVLSLVGCGNKEKEIEISEVMGCYTIDVYSYEELAGNADYVMIGKVVDELGVDYKWPVMKENEDGTQTELTKPYTKYSVEVIENLKGCLLYTSRIQQNSRNPSVSGRLY